MTQTAEKTEGPHTTPPLGPCLVYTPVKLLFEQQSAPPVTQTQAAATEEVPIVSGHARNVIKDKGIDQISRMRYKYMMWLRLYGPYIELFIISFQVWTHPSL